MADLALRLSDFGREAIKLGSKYISSYKQSVGTLFKKAGAH